MKYLIFGLLAMLKLSSFECRADEPEWLERDQMIARIPDSKGPAVLGFGLMQDGKFSTPKTGKSLDARFSSTLFFVISHLDAWLAEVGNPEDDFPKAWHLLKSGGSEDPLKQAEIVLAQTVIDQKKAVQQRLQAVGDSPQVEAMDLEITRQDEAVKSAQKKLDELKLNLSVAAKALEHGVEDLGTNFRLRLGEQTFVTVPPKNRMERLPGSKPLHLITFSLREINEDKESWLNLLKASPLASVSCEAALAYQHPESRESILAATPAARLRIPLFTWAFWVNFIIIGGFFALFIKNMRQSEMLRDSGIVLINRTPKSKDYWHQYAHPLSMGRLQMSIWFFIIIASFVFLWCATGSIAGVSSTAFILMGISGGTTAISCFISSKQEWDAKVRSAASPNRSRLANWVIDLLSDEHGPTIHRFQMLAWTLVLGVVFVHDVITDYAMPAFSNEVLGLMGISSGVYVGFKMKEGAPAPEPKSVDDA
jgi:hypothetical protein